MNRAGNQSLQPRRGMTIFPAVKLVLMVAVLYFLNMVSAFLTIRSWLLGTQNRLLSGDLVDQIGSLVIVLFIGSAGVFAGILLYMQIVEHPSGRPARGCSMVKFSVWFCGFSGFVNVAGIMGSWFGMTGANS